MPIAGGGVLAIVIGWALFGLAHSLLVRAWMKRWAERLLGPAFLAGFYRPVFALLSTVLLAWLWLLPGDLAGDLPLAALPGTLRPLAYLVKAIALGLVVASFREIDFLEFIGLAQLLRWARGEYRELRPTPPETFPLAQAKEPLACRGVYLWVRHPLNTAVIVWIWAQPTYSLYDVVFAACLTAYILIANRFEEGDLLRRYGVAYASYRKIVPAFFSGFRNLRGRRRELQAALLVETTRGGSTPPQPDADAGDDNSRAN